jgi:hypothetical protein
MNISQDRSYFLFLIFNNAAPVELVKFCEFFKLNITISLYELSDFGILYN